MFWQKPPGIIDISTVPLMFINTFMIIYYLVLG